MANRSKTSLIIISLLIIAVLGISIGFRISPTGFVVGYATVDVAGTVGITIPDNAVNLSLGNDSAEIPGAYVNTNTSSAIINSAGTGDGNGSYSTQNWLNVSDSAARAIEPDNITVNNSGTVIATITMSSGGTPATLFGTSGGDFWVKVTNSSEGDGIGCQGTQTVTFTQYGTNSTTLCTQLGTLDGEDGLDIWIQWQIPSAAIESIYNSTLTISAAEAS
jgi:hypothetical protein